VSGGVSGDLPRRISKHQNLRDSAVQPRLNSLRRWKIQIHGKDVGPNLASIRQWNPEQALINILDPNREVAPNFVGYTVETKDGRTLDGIITDESVASVTLKRAEGVTETVFRRDIVTITGSGLSLMPEGLESAITVEQMADLLAFLLLPS